MLAVGVGGALLITQTSLRTMATHTGRGVGAVAKPLGQAHQAGAVRPVDAQQRA